MHIVLEMHWICSRCCRRSRVPQVRHPPCPGHLDSRARRRYSFAFGLVPCCVSVRCLVHWCLAVSQVMGSKSLPSHPWSCLGSWSSKCVDPRKNGSIPTPEDYMILSVISSRLELMWRSQVPTGSPSSTDDQHAPAKKHGSQRPHRNGDLNTPH